MHKIKHHKPISIAIIAGGIVLAILLPAFKHWPTDELFDEDSWAN